MEKNMSENDTIAIRRPLGIKVGTLLMVGVAIPFFLYALNLFLIEPYRWGGMWVVVLIEHFSSG